jgi:hypothetical protein
MLYALKVPNEKAITMQKMDDPTENLMGMHGLITTIKPPITSGTP